MIRDAQRGFALLAVMLVLALLGIVGAEFAFSMRLEASMVRAYKDGVQALHLAEAGIHQAIREVLAEGQIQGLDEDGQLTFYRTQVGQTAPVKLPRLRRERHPLGQGQFSYRITDEEARINVNLAAPERMERLLAALGVEAREREIVVDSIQDWKDANDEYRVNGAESDYYLKLPLPYRARNSNLQDPAELLQIRGVTTGMYHGRRDPDGKRAAPGLAEHVTVWGRNVVNMNTAGVPVLKALNLSDAEIEDIVQGRQRSPYPFVPGRYAGRGLGVGGQTFRIESEGWIAGELRLKLIAVVQRAARGPLAPGTAPGARPAARAPAQRVASAGVTVLAWRLAEPDAGSMTEER